MSEFTLHHCVSELMAQLGVNSSDPVGVVDYTDKLLKSRTPYVTTQISSSQAKKRIAESTETPIEFLTKYDELKEKKVRDLDSLVCLLSKLTDDHQTKAFLERDGLKKAQAEGLTLMPHSKVTSKLPLPGSKMTPEEFQELKNVLSQHAQKVENPPSDFLTKIEREQKIKKKVNIPRQPDWLFQREHLSADFVTSSDRYNEGNVVVLGTLPRPSQEQAMLTDLLFCLRGIEGSYVLPQPVTERYAEREFLIDQSLDVSMQDLVKRILPLCAHYSTVIRFIEEKSCFEYGMVNHALCEAMDTLIQDYLILVAQLEQQMKTGQLSLQKLCFYLQPTMRMMEILASIANAINRGRCIGGAVLSLLHEKTASMVGDVKSSELCLYLTQAACVPYMRILQKWIYRGIIQDPYSEFLVEENEAIQKDNLQKEYNDAYWEKHYTVFQERIPVFLEQVADKILNTGKYLNVVRQCGRDVNCPFAEELIYTVKERRYFEQIERAYSYASELLLTLLMKEKELMARLKSIKHYFLLDKGDFIVQFMDMTEVEMKQNVDDIHLSRLESLLELVLRTSTANVDPFKDDLKVDLLPFDLTSQLLQILAIESKQEKEYRIDPTDIRLSGLESFSFDYMVKWPTSLILSRKALTRYQILFRHLFYCKHVERQLSRNFDELFITICPMPGIGDKMDSHILWMVNKQMKMYTRSSTRWYSSAFALNQRMLNFVQNFEYYMMFEVIDLNWQTFQDNMLKVSNVDEVLAFHTDFLDSCLKDCMLTHTELLRIVHKLLMVCVTFSNYVQRVGKASSIENETERLRDSSLQSSLSNAERREDAQKRKMTTKVFSEHVDQVLADENFEQTIHTFDHNFSRHLLDLLDKILEESKQASGNKLFNIICRLDFNGFYTEQLEAMSASRAVKDMASLSVLSDGSSHSSNGNPPMSFTSQQPESARYVPGQYRTSREF